MCAQTMINNACTMQTYIDDHTEGEKLYVQFYDTTSEHTYTVENKWDADSGDMFGDVNAMCRLLSKRGLRAADLVLGADAAQAVTDMEKVQRLLDKNSGIVTGRIQQELSPYEGVVFMGYLNFKGFQLNLISADETYVDDSKRRAALFPCDVRYGSCPWLRTSDVWPDSADRLRRDGLLLPLRQEGPVVCRRPASQHEKAAARRAPACRAEELLPVHLRGQRGGLIWRKCESSLAITATAPTRLDRLYPLDRERQ